jgi:cytoskeletal protein RodZ
VALSLSRVDRIYRDYTVTATNTAGGAATVTGVDVALLPPRTSPTAATTWTATTYASGVARVLLAGPDAPGSGALVVPTDGADVWLRVSDSPEVDAERIERVVVT